MFFLYVRICYQNHCASSFAKFWTLYTAALHIQEVLSVKLLVFFCLIRKKKFQTAENSLTRAIPNPFIKVITSCWLFRMDQVIYLNIWKLISNFRIDWEFCLSQLVAVKIVRKWSCFRIFVCSKYNNSRKVVWNPNLENFTIAKIKGSSTNQRMCHDDPLAFQMKMKKKLSTKLYGQGANFALSAFISRLYSIWIKQWLQAPSRRRRISLLISIWWNPFNLDRFPKPFCCYCVDYTLLIFAVICNDLSLCHFAICQRWKKTNHNKNADMIMTVICSLWVVFWRASATAVQRMNNKYMYLYVCVVPAKYSRTSIHSICMMYTHNAHKDHFHILCRDLFLGQRTMWCSVVFSLSFLRSLVLSTSHIFIDVLFLIFCF